MSDNKKRITFHCWNTANCGREYSWLVEFGRDALLLTACPFCGSEAEVELADYRSPVWNTHAATGNDPGYTLDVLVLPDVLPSRPRKK